MRNTKPPKGDWEAGVATLCDGLRLMLSAFRDEPDSNEPNSNETTDALYISSTEFARMFSLSQSHVRRMLRNGVIKGSQVGSGWKIPRSEVERFSADLRGRSVEHG